MNRFTELYRRLAALSEIASGACANQRALAARLDLSLGLVNGLLQELQKERLIRVGAANESPYSVTTKGRAAMVKLSTACASEADVLLEGFRGEMEKLAAGLRAQKRRVALICGNGALAELAAAALQNNGVRVAGVVARDPGKTRIAGMRVRRIEDAPKIKQDVCVAMTAEDAKALRKAAGKGARIVQTIPGK